MNVDYKIVESIQELESLIGGSTGPAVLDVETFKKRPEQDGSRLLGIALSGHDFNGPKTLYIPLRAFQEGQWVGYPLLKHSSALASILERFNLIGHNFTFDKAWIDHNFGISTRWLADTRIMWHLSAIPSTRNTYGLKRAQVELLGWEESNEKALEEQVRARGGKLKNGDHYLADVALLGRYACLDAYSTLLLFDKLKPFFDQHNYWEFLRWIMDYNELLAENSKQGIKLDVEGLKKVLKEIESKKEEEHQNIRKVCSKEIAELEELWKDRRQAFFNTERGRKWFLSSPERWPRFNPSSDLHLGQLYYDQLGFPVMARTEGGRPKVDKQYLRTMKHLVTAHVLEYNRYEKIEGYASSYLKAQQNGRLHPNFDICGTVSGRLSGFSPNLQQAPFKEREVMKNFICDDGMIGIHMDLAGIEPCVTAHYSEDPTLLKVYRDGLGDIYLDLALEMFPHNKELFEQYNPKAKLDSKLKDRFKTVRDIAKTVHLALQYNGTEFTVSKTLTLAGIPTTPDEARALVKAYWKTFNAVKVLNWRLKELHAKEGMLRNIVGRIIRVPETWERDIPNRFIQSSAHDILVLFVQTLALRAKAEGIKLIPMVIDIHDSTTWQCEENKYEAAYQLFEDSLRDVNSRLGLCVQVRGEIKRIVSLAGLKGD